MTYSNEAKIRTLSVPAELIAEHGAVSPECAEAMAAGIRQYAKTDHAISVTGIAGPDGGSDAKPVGTVFIGYAGPKRVKSIKVVLPGDPSCPRPPPARAGKTRISPRELKFRLLFQPNKQKISFRLFETLAPKERVIVSVTGVIRIQVQDKLKL